MRRLSLLLTPLLFSCALQAEVGQLDNTRTSQLLEQGVPIIDVRTASEWRETGVIEGSHQVTFFDEKGHYDVNAFVRELNKIAGPDQPFILVCRSGNRTGKISRFLDEKLKYQQVMHVARGIKGWIHEGYPVSRNN